MPEILRWSQGQANLHLELLEAYIDLVGLQNTLAGALDLIEDLHKMVLRRDENAPPDFKKLPDFYVEQMRPLAQSLDDEDIEPLCRCLKEALFSEPDEGVLAARLHLLRTEHVDLNPKMVLASFEKEASAPQRN